jgi:3-oxoadipate enol-lactonase
MLLECKEPTVDAVLTIETEVSIPVRWALLDWIRIVLLTQLSMPKTITNDIETYYEIHGHGHPLVLIHGVAGCHNAWQMQIPLLSKYLRVITYDIRGHGESTGNNEKYSIELFANDFKILLDNLGVTKSHICGFSMGGLIAQQFAIDYSSKVDKLVLADTFCHMSSSDKILMLLMRVMNRIVLSLVGIDRFLAIGARFTFRKSEQRALRDFYVKEVNRISKQEFLKTMDTIYSFDSFNKLEEIIAPTLIICAEGLKQEQQQADIMHRTLKNSKKELIPDTYHASNLEKPEEFNKLILEFLLTPS